MSWPSRAPGSRSPPKATNAANNSASAASTRSVRRTASISSRPMSAPNTTGEQQARERVRGDAPELLAHQIHGPRASIPFPGRRHAQRGRDATAHQQAMTAGSQSQQQGPRSRLRRSFGRCLALGIIERQQRRGFQVFELVVVDRPEEGHHRAISSSSDSGIITRTMFMSRSRGAWREPPLAHPAVHSFARCAGALRMTPTELSDMPSAASQGEMNPSAASGTAVKL